MRLFLSIEISNCVSMKMKESRGEMGNAKELKILLSKRKVNLDDVFKEYIGEGGRYQIFLLIMLSVNAFCQATVFGDIIWVTDTKPHWCALPGDVNPALHNLTLKERFNVTVPWIEKDGQWVYDSCYTYDLNYSSIPHGERTTQMSVKACSSWEFDTSELKNTIVEKVRNVSLFHSCDLTFISSQKLRLKNFLYFEQWNMVCDRKILIATTRSIFLASFPVGALLGGILTDR